MRGGGSVTYRAQIEALLAAGAYPGDAEAAAQVGCTEVTTEDYRQRWQRIDLTVCLMCSIIAIR